MGFKEEFKHEMKNVMKDIEKEVEKTWTFEYKGHVIEVTNQMKEESLIIDGITVVHKKRKHLLSHIMPYSKLSSTLELKDGTKHTVTVKLGGYVNLNCVVKINNETVLQESSKIELLPWEYKEKILPYIQQEVQENNRIIEDYLPDEEYFYRANQPKLVAGLFDQLEAEPPTPFYVKKLVKLFKDQIDSPTIKTRKATYEKIISEHMASYREELIEHLEQVSLEEEAAQQEAIWLLEHATHRDVVKFSILILGFTDCEKYKDLLFTIGMHDEFTPYVIFAWRNGMRNANEEIFKLAQVTYGYGRMTAIEHLEATTPEKKQWLLTNGCKDCMQHEYLAYSCAVKGELDIALHEETISKELYDGAGAILVGLLKDVFNEVTNDYPYTSIVLSRFIHHGRIHCTTLEDFYVLVTINRYLQVEEEIWEERYQHHWKQHERLSIQEAIQPLLHNSKWLQLTKDAIQTDFDYHVMEIAHFFDVDITTPLFEMLERNPTNSFIYSAVMDTKSLSQIKAICTFVEKHFSLASLSAEEEDCLQYIVQDLHGFEGVGLPIIHAALESNNNILSYQALTVLEEWEPPLWKQPIILEALKRIANTSSDKEDRKLAKHLLSK